MYILIYRTADGKIRNITNCESYFRKGTSLVKIKNTIPTFNEKNPDNRVELRKVPKKQVDILEALVPDDVELMTSPILHNVNDYVKANRYIYEFVKFEGHDFPLIKIMKTLYGEDYRIAELEHPKGELPYAWCYAKDLLDLLGISKAAMNEMLQYAKSQAWGWYKEANKEE